MFKHILIIGVSVMLVLFLRSCISRDHADARAASLYTFNPSTRLRHLTLPDPATGATVDYHKLAVAISFAETGGGRDGTAIHRNNCCGLMEWDKNGVRHPRYFKSYQDSIDAAAALWARAYKRFPDATLAAKWTGNDNPDNWLSTVQTVYASL